MKCLLVITCLFIIQLESKGQNTFELKPSQSMMMTGKGPGQDATINPFEGKDCLAIVKNLGENTFSVRIQFKGKIKETIVVEPKSTKNVNLPKDHELYFDTKKETTVEISYKDKPEVKRK